MSFDVEKIRADFPALRQMVHGKPLVYLDSAATALKPQAVIDAVVSVYAQDCANVHRGVHTLSQRATARYEASREKVRGFLNAASADEIVFTRGTTESINMVAQSWARDRLGPGDEVVLTGLEHHSNIVPWQLVAQATGAKLTVVPLDARGDVGLDAIGRALEGGRVKLVAMSHVSNALGTILPVEAVIERAHAAGARVLLDGAQAAPHLPVDVRALGVDFYALSGHKLYGPTGVGVLYAPAERLAEMGPYQGGGDMIREVTFEASTYADPPALLEAGTPNIAGVIGLGAAIDYVEAIGREALHAHERALLAYGTEALSTIEGLTLVGTAERKVGVLSFVMEGAHPHDIGTLLDADGVAVRTGHHCAQPVMQRYEIPATARASFGMYNTQADLDALTASLRKVREIFS